MRRAAPSLLSPPSPRRDVRGRRDKALSPSTRSSSRPGFRIGVYARVPHARSMALAPGGTLFVGTREERGLRRPRGTADAGRRGRDDRARASRRPTASPFATARSTSPRSRGSSASTASTARLDDPRQARRRSRRLPERRRTTAGSSSRSARTAGSTFPSARRATSASRKDPVYAAIHRMKPDGSAVELFACGIRNTVGFDWDPRRRSSGSPTTGATGSATTCRPTSSTARRAPGCTSAFRTATAGRHPRSRVRKEAALRGLHAAGDPARPARRRARHALLHGHDVPGRVPQSDLHRRARLLEPRARRSATA